jgi:hypothetical protein
MPQPLIAAPVMGVTITKEINMSNKKLKQADLYQFSGTENWYRHSMISNFLYTDGVKYVAEKAGAYWLIDAIAFGQLQPAVAAEAFQMWTLNVNLETSSAILACEDGNGNTVYTLNIEYTDFPLAKIRYYYTGNVLLLASEY